MISEDSISHINEKISPHSPSFRPLPFFLFHLLFSSTFSSHPLPLALSFAPCHLSFSSFSSFHLIIPSILVPYFSSFSTSSFFLESGSLAKMKGVSLDRPTDIRAWIFHNTTVILQA